MKRPLQLLLLTALLGGPALALAAGEANQEVMPRNPDAHFAEGGGDGWGHRHEGWKRFHHEGMGRRHMLLRHVARCYAQADKKGDGKLSLEEAHAGLPALAEDFTRIDSNHDGLVDRMEMRQTLREYFHSRPEAGQTRPPFFAWLDSYQGEKITLDKLKTAFAHADVNKTGVVTPRQLHEAMNSLPEECGR